MDEASQQPHSFGSGEQRSPHPRPFFYVQPPSQPYYLYPQWQLSNPYNNFGLPTGFNLSRPCMHPYPYGPYPGFVLPHAPIYPMDYRRMFEPRFQHSPAWNDVPRQQHHPQPQPHGRRETTCSGAQTDPSDAISKLIECLDKIRATELQSADRELDSGVASHSSGLFSPEERKKEEQGRTQSSVPHDVCLESPAVTFDSTAAVYDSESSQMILDPPSPQECWTRGLEEELPLDSSSFHEECSEQTLNTHLISLEKEVVTDIQTNISVSDSSVFKCDADLQDTQPPTFPSSMQSLNEANSSDKISKVDLGTSFDEAKPDECCQILKLPFDSVVTPGGGSLSPSSASYYYNYLPMQATHERMSVLSPSLDELSSRDEMFSTDLDDDLFPKRVYTGKKLTDFSGSPQAADDPLELWLPYTKRVVCACCGRSLAKGTVRSKVHSSKMHRDEAGDSEEEGKYGRGCEQSVRVVVRKHSAPRKTQPMLQRHTAKPWYKRSQYKELSEPVKQGEHQAEATEAGTELDSSELQCRTCQEGHCREDLTLTDGWTEGDIIPRRRQAGLLQRQEMNPQWKLMYHRPKDEDHDDEAPLLHWERGMAAATTNWQHSYGLGPRGPKSKLGADPTKGPHQAAPPPPGPPRPEEQQHHKPFFYIQPQQPYLPMQSLQWPVALPMPVSYNPYYGYPGFGYGLSMMPHYQPNSYMESPGFVVPHTHLHLMDYRRVLNPQHYQTMAYHARRFRYQHNSSAKEMTSSEVQTEPLESAHRTSAQSSHNNLNNTSSISTEQRLSPVLAVQKDHSSELQEKVPTSSTTKTPSNDSFVIQTEEVRIECCSTPVGLQLLHAHENADVSHRFSQDMIQCSSLLQSLKDEGLKLPGDQSEQELQVCPDILLVGKLSTSEKILTLEEPGNHTNLIPKNSSLGFEEVPCSKAEDTNDDFGVNANKFHLKDIHLPFDPTYLDELRKMESAVWSAEETLISSPELMIQNSFVKSNSISQTANIEANAPETLVFNEEAPIEIVQVIEMVPQAEDELEVPLVETMGSEMTTSEGDICLTAEDSPMSELTNSTEVAPFPNLVALDNLPLKAGGDQQKQEMNDDDNQDTSFESLPAYLPSTSWLSHFDHSYYCNKIPPASKKQNRSQSSRSSNVPKRRRKLDMDYIEQPCIRKPKERYKPKGKVDRQSFSDHECCVSRNFNENLFSPSLSNKERLCSRCMAKRRVCTSPFSECDGQSLKRKAVPFQQWNDCLLPTCDTCRSHTKQRLRKDFNSNLCSPYHRCDTEGDSSGNSSCRTTPKGRAANDSVKLTEPKRPLTPKQNVNRPPVVIYPKLMDCVCNDLQHHSVAWERLRHCPHGNTIREMDENCAGPVSLKNKWRNVDQIYLTHSWQSEKSWMDVMPNTDGDCSKSEPTSHVINHKKAQTQGTLTKDTRC